jgi:hypothetical protein
MLPFFFLLAIVGRPAGWIPDKPVNFFCPLPGYPARLLKDGGDYSPFFFFTF